MIEKEEQPFDTQFFPEIIQPPKPYSFFDQKIEQRVLHFYINQEIEEPEKYTEMVHRIQFASPMDIVYIHLNTIGGDLSTGMQIINAMKASHAHVVTAIEGEVASMGTFIFLCGDEFVVHDYSIMMIHNYTGGVFGKGHEQIAALTATTKFVKSFMTQVYTPFLSEEEIKQILDGADLYLQAPDIRKRLVKMTRQSKSEKEKTPKRTG